MTSWFNSLFMQKPVLLILLEDTPKNVCPQTRARPRTNNTLPKLHRRYCKTAQWEFVRLDVSEYTQQELAEEVIRIMLKKLGPLLFDYVPLWKSKHDQS